ncbi:helix-turn-helix domain-containing protein, partial [Mannheimia haemolytica]|nr:helix-turn-helix domain-containing protein [Mannheimia haemolytica]
MFYSNNPLIKHKTGLLNLAEELGNISQACKVMGMSRDTFYRYQQAVEQGMSRDTFYRYQQAVEQ